MLPSRVVFGVTRPLRADQPLCCAPWSAQAQSRHRYGPSPLRSITIRIATRRPKAWRSVGAHLDQSLNHRHAQKPGRSGQSATCMSPVSALGLPSNLPRAWQEVQPQPFARVARVARPVSARALRGGQPGGTAQVVLSQAPDRN